MKDIGKFEVQEARVSTPIGESRDEFILEQKPMEESAKMSKNDFELLKTVGKGSFGKVFQVGVYHCHLILGAI